MKTFDIINSTLSSQQDGKELLGLIKVDLTSINSQYHNCDLMRSIINVKFDIDKLNSAGYSLQEILDATPTDGIMADEVHKFILSKLQSFISMRDSQLKKQAQDAANAAKTTNQETSTSSDAPQNKS